MKKTEKHKVINWENLRNNKNAKEFNFKAPQTFQHTQNCAVVAKKRKVVLGILIKVLPERHGRCYGSFLEWCGQFLAFLFQR